MMPLDKGDRLMPRLNTADNVYLGGSQVDRVYLGANLVWDLFAVVASGGDNVYDDGGYRYHVFTTVGSATFEVQSPGSDGLVEYLLVAGGGGGGGAWSNHPRYGGGGGAGEVYVGSTVLAEGSFSVVVGDGGEGAKDHTVTGVAGGDSSFNGITVIGGGGGGSTSTSAGVDGGSGSGGAAGDTWSGSGGSSVGSHIGHDGADGVEDSYAGGGGGAGGPASQAQGGPGYEWGGAVYAHGGDGAEGAAGQEPEDAAANTGDGGGGRSGAEGDPRNGGDGGSGVVIVRYPLGWGALPDENTAIGARVAGGFFAGIIDTSQSGAILPEDEYQTPLRYALIVAPRSLQITDEWRTSQATVPEAQTRWDGLAAQEALVAPNGDSTYPAFNHCHGLIDFGGVDPTGDGYNISQPGEVSRWYLPALDELTEAYWNLKPTTDDNSTTTREQDFPDDGFEQGELFSSDPQRPPFTSGTPEQTDVTDFREGGDEEFVEGTARAFFSASWASSDLVWAVFFLNGACPATTQTFKRRIRPFRRVVL